MHGTVRRHTAGMQKVFLVENSPLVRERLNELLGAVAGSRIVGHASTADAAIAAILAERLGARGYFDKSKDFERVRDLVAARAAGNH